MKVARGAKLLGKKKFNKPQGLEDLKKFGKADNDDSEDDDSEDDDMNVDDSLEFDDDSDGDSGDEKAANKGKNNKTLSKNKPFDKSPGKKTPNSATNKLTPAKNTQLNKNNQTPGKNSQTLGKKSGKNAHTPGQNIQTPGNKVQQLQKTPSKLAGSPINKFGKQQSAKKQGTPNKKPSLANKANDDEEEDDEEDDEEEDDEEEDDEEEDEEDSSDEEDDDEDQEDDKIQATIAKTPKENPKVAPKTNIQNKGSSHYLQDAADARRQEDSRTLFVKKLPADVKQSDFNVLCPDVVQARLSKRPPWYAFLTFADEETAEKNFSLLKDKMYKGQALYVDYVGAKSSVQRKADGEIDPCKLFVGNISPDTTEKMLGDAFPNNNEVFIPKRKGAPARFGFVNFRTPQAAKEAYDKMQDAVINKQVVRIMFAHKKMKPTPGDGKIDPCNLFVGNISPDTTEEMLRDAFPNNNEVFIPKRKSIRFGFVNFQTPQAAREAYDKMQDAVINNQVVRIMFAHKRIKQTQPVKRKRPKKKKPPQKKTKLDTPKIKPKEEIKEEIKEEPKEEPGSPANDDD